MLVKSVVLHWLNNNTNLLTHILNVSVSKWMIHNIMSTLILWLKPIAFHKGCFGKLVFHILKVFPFIISLFAIILKMRKYGVLFKFSVFHVTESRDTMKTETTLAILSLLFTFFITLLLVQCVFFHLFIVINKCH